MSQPLQQQNTRSLLVRLPLVMLVGSLFFYIILVGHIQHTKHQQLQLKQTNVWKAFGKDPIHTPTSLQGEYSITPGPIQQDIMTDSSDLALMIQSHTLSGVNYRVTTYVSAKEYYHLMVKIALAEVFIFAGLLIAVVIVNRRSSARLWTPFYATMGAVRKYDIRQNQPLSLEANTGINEFDGLNKTLLDLIEHVDQAYRNQKQFTENASHELQTPLAIIRSKVELLMESPGLNEDSAQLLQEITDANERLSQMNKHLLLLTRIENGQFPEATPIDLSQLIEKQTRFFKEYYDTEIARTSTTIQPRVEIVANMALIEILVNNLLRNAYIHNISGGWVTIQLTPTSLIIENSGPAIEGDPERLFDRFRKGRVDNRTTGLGLALVRQIAQLYRYDIRYLYNQGTHSITLSF